jgi:hypothetical protein
LIRLSCRSTSTCPPRIQARRRASTRASSSAPTARARSCARAPAPRRSAGRTISAASSPPCDSTRRLAPPSSASCRAAARSPSCHRSPTAPTRACWVRPRDASSRAMSTHTYAIAATTARSFGRRRHITRDTCSHSRTPRLSTQSTTLFSRLTFRRSARTHQSPRRHSSPTSCRRAAAPFRSALRKRRPTSAIGGV